MTKNRPGREKPGYENSKLAGNAGLWNDGVLDSDPEFGSSGFMALPGGSRSSNGSFSYLGDYMLFWTAKKCASSAGWYRLAYYNSPGVARYFAPKSDGLSVRCVKD